MYDELIEELRQHHCDAKEDDTQEVCEECAYDVIIADKSAPSGIASICVCGLMNRAADDIEKLLAELEYTERQYDLAVEDLEKIGWGEWIPVTERLPEYMENVLVTDGVFSGMGWRDYYDCHGTKPKEDCWISPNTNVNDLGITHWMPLPQPPEDGEA